MASLDPQEAYTLENAVDPNSEVFKSLMAKLLKPRKDTETRAGRYRSKGVWKYTLPFKADMETEQDIMENFPFKFANYGIFRNGARSLAALMDAMVDLVVVASGRSRMAPVLVASAEHETVIDCVASGGSVSPLVKYCGLTNLYEQLVAVRPDVMIVDHTTVNVPVDELLNLAFGAGVRVVDGVFPYHVGAVRGWDVVSGFGKWSYTHTADCLSVGPDDDSTRLLKYTHRQYNKFINPKLWKGKSTRYLYEIRKYTNGLATYRAVYVGDEKLPPKEDMSFKLPMCSADDMVLITINRQLAAGVYASKSNNASELRYLDKDYAIEMRRDLFDSCVTYLIGRDRGADVMGDSIRYITQHNYVDLVDGVRIVRKHWLSYADALCASMVCALVAYDLRYRLTHDMVPVVNRNNRAATLKTNAPLGMLGRLVWVMSTYVGDAASALLVRSVTAAVDALYSREFIPGVCYDLYHDVHYKPDAEWFEAINMVVEEPEVPELDLELDPFANFMGDNVRAYAPNVVKRKNQQAIAAKIQHAPYTHNVIPQPAYALQEVYDQLFPGNSTAQLQNVAELKRVKDIDVNTEFYGRIEINKDIAAPEKVHDDAPIRTAALPISRTPLVDAILASAKRNWNPPDMQMQNNVWEYAQSLVDEFIDWAFVPGFRKTIGRAYKANPVTFNVTDYMAWKAGKDMNYRKMLEDECPGDLVELELERYDTIIKKRVKPKLSVTAQQELGQGQVIVSMSKKDTALFTSVFRVMFERLDGALRPEICSAGRLSDASISEWVTDNLEGLRALKALEIDSGKYDKSQNLLARMIEALMFIALGLDPGVMDIFADSYVGKVSSKVLGLMFISAYQMKSGAPHTMLGNLVYNMISAAASVGKQHIRYMIAKGDDNVVWVTSGVDEVLTVYKMSSLFNLEAKLIAGAVLYFSSGYILLLEDAGYFVPDLAKIIELLGEKGMDPLTRPERYVSFRDRVGAYAVDQAIPPVLQAAVRSRLDKPEVDVVMAVDALLTVADSYETYEAVVPS